jgi:hypothetical protein
MEQLTFSDYLPSIYFNLMLFFVALLIYKASLKRTIIRLKREWKWSRLRNEVFYKYKNGD